MTMIIMMMKMANIANWQSFLMMMTLTMMLKKLTMMMMMMMLTMMMIMKLSLKGPFFIFAISDIAELGQ